MNLWYTLHLAASVMAVVYKWAAKRTSLYTLLSYLFDALGTACVDVA